MHNELICKYGSENKQQTKDMFKRLTLLLLIILSTQLLFAIKHKKREMRAVWVATVANLDWPSQKGLDSETQKKEFIDMLNLFQKNNINTVIVQVRPSGDAIYPSKYSNWSEWLTGKQGQQPTPYYDPLAFMIEECHKRCMEIHAWFNPFRAVYNYHKHQVCENHITKRHPEWTITYGRHKYLNPGIPEVREYVSNIIKEVVINYNIDAIHFDDYFYPYSNGTDFPDDISFQDYGESFNGKKDWRRENINKFIKDVSENIHKTKPEVKFGISPFPVWRTKKNDKQGIDLAASSSYDDLSADILLWMKRGWIDYVMPQLYGHIGQKNLDYKKLAEWWSNKTNNANLYIGQAIYKIDPNSEYKEWQNSNQLLRQIEINQRYSKIKGHSFFRAGFLKNNPLNINQKLMDSFHKYPALNPINEKITPLIPQKPKLVILEKEDNILTLSWESYSDNNTYFIVYRSKGLFRRFKAKNIYTITRQSEITIPLKDAKGFKYFVTSVSRTHHESNAEKAYTIRYQ